MTNGRASSSSGGRMFVLIETMAHSRRVYVAQWIAFVSLTALAAKKAADVVGKSPLARAHRAS